MKPDSLTPAQKQFETYDYATRQTSYSFMLYPAILLFAFGLLAVVWAIPFPYLAFLGKYNGFINWASFLIAGVIYYYVRQMPVVSYVLLLMVFGFSYLIIQLEQWPKAGGLQLWVVGLVALLLGAVTQYLLLQPKAGIIIKLLLGPAWLVQKLLPAKINRAR